VTQHMRVDRERELSLYSSSRDHFAHIAGGHRPPRSEMNRYGEPGQSRRSCLRARNSGPRKGCVDGTPFLRR
jgi:hypothetical protein